MNRGVARLFAVAVASIALVPALPAAAQSRNFYIDYEAGNDGADGLSPSTAWRHAPGDAAATGNAKRLKLQPGDQVRFKGGVRYRGALTPRAVGSTDNPVVFDGSSWGSTRAIIDGSNPLQGVRRCQSAADCLGSPHWQNLWRADLPGTARWTDYLFVNDQIFQMSQYPSLAKLDADNSHQYLLIPKAETGRLATGSIRHPFPAGFSKGDPVLALWVQGNLIALADNVQVSTSGVEFAGANWVNAPFRPFTDRDERFSLMNLPDQVERPGLFAMSPKDGVVIFWPMAAGARASGGVLPTPAVSIGGRRGGITTSLASNFVVRGFSFTSFAGIPGNYSAGSVIRSSGATPGVVIANNSIRSVVNIEGPAVIHMVGPQHVRIENNQIIDAPWTRGILIDNSAGPTTIRCNTMSEIGNTAIRVLNVKDSSVLGNQLTKIRSRHGNGITAYLDLRNVRIAGNVVTETIRPLTVEGLFGNKVAYFSDGTPGVTISDNVLMGGDGINGALTSYGYTPNLVISNNFLYSIPNALKIAGNETGFEASGNQMIGKVLQPKASPLFSPEGNVFHEEGGNGALLIRQMQRSKPPAGYCS